MIQKNILIIVLTVVITSLIVGGGIYWWQESVLEKTTNEMSEQNNDLQAQVNNLQAQIENLQSQIDQMTTEKNELQQQIYELTKEPEKYVKVISPNGGEVICLNRESIIEWKSKGVNAVGVRVIKQAFGGTSYYYIGLNSVPATSNGAGISGEGKAVWKVTNIPAGDGYKIEITSSENSKIADTSDGIFSISLCEE